MQAQGGHAGGPPDCAGGPPGLWHDECRFSGDRLGGRSRGAAASRTRSTSARLVRRNTLRAVTRVIGESQELIERDHPALRGRRSPGGLPGRRQGDRERRESLSYGISTDVQRQDRFWIKSQPYSLHDMLANDGSVDQFVGGPVYQAFLSATNYHRWHSPVAGRIVRAFVQEGTYCVRAGWHVGGLLMPDRLEGNAGAPRREG